MNQFDLAVSGFFEKRKLLKLSAAITSIDKFLYKYQIRF